MVSQIRRGILDMIGAARPSIADPFLPRKIEEGRLDDIRECIGCNICVSGDFTMTPMRCTQNPTMGEEWRRGLHPEIVSGKASDDSVLVVGAGPAGLECARALGSAAYAVHLAEATEELGGRVTRESQLPGLAAWARVRDHRLLQLDKMVNVSIYRASRLEAADVRRWAPPMWSSPRAPPGAATASVGRTAPPFPASTARTSTRPTTSWPARRSRDRWSSSTTDHYYIGGVLAEKLRGAGLAVTLVTPAESASIWTHNTLEHERIQTRLLELGIEIVANREVTAFHGDHVATACVYTRRPRDIPCRSVVTVTARLPDDDLCRSLHADLETLPRPASNPSPPSATLSRRPPSAHAVFAGHRYAREPGRRGRLRSSEQATSYRLRPSDSSRDGFNWRCSSRRTLAPNRSRPRRPARAHSGGRRRPRGRWWPARKRRRWR